MRILVTGSGGFVGTETVKLLEEHGHRVVPYDLMDGFDIREKRKMHTYISHMKEIGNIDRILHLAAIARFSEADENPMRAYETNVIGTQNVAELADAHGIPVVYASTGSVYMPIEQDPPITEDMTVRGNSVYGVTKALGEKFIQQMKAPWIILRYAHLYGREKRHHGLIGGFLQRIKRGLVPTLYGGKQSNDFTYIRDVAYANLLALTAPWDSWNNAYNIGTGEELTAEKAGEIVCRMSGYTGEIEKKTGRTVDPQRFVYDTRKAERMLGFKAQYTFEKGLKDMFRVEGGETS